MIVKLFNKIYHLHVKSGSKAITPLQSRYGLVIEVIHEFEPDFFGIVTKLLGVDEYPDAALIDGLLEGLPIDIIKYGRGKDAIEYYTIIRIIYL